MFSSETFTANSFHLNPPFSAAATQPKQIMPSPSIEEFSYTDDMGCIASSDGIFCTFDIAKVEQNYPHTFNSLAVTLGRKLQNTNKSSNL